MRIGIDARSAMAVNDGIGRYACELLAEYAKRDSADEYFVLKNPLTRVSFALDERFHEIVVDAGRFGAGAQLSLPRLLRPLRLDVFHALHFSLPLAYRGAMVMTVHDILPILSPWSFGRGAVGNAVASTYINLLIRASIHRSRLVAVSSENTLRDVVTHLHADPQKLRKAYLGINVAEFAPPPEAEVVPARLGLHGPFFLTVTNFKPHKNTGRLVEAFRLVRQTHPEASLAIIGADARGLARGLGDPQMLAAENIKVLGYQDDATVTALMSQAIAFVYPSRYEGFGFPLVEAMAAGAAVVSSTAASLPELGGDAVLYADPDDARGFADGMARIMKDGALRKSLQEQGRRRAASFQWSATADAMLAMYREAARQGGGADS